MATRLPAYYEEINVLLILITDMPDAGVAVGRKFGVKNIVKTESLSDMNLILWVSQKLLKGKDVALVTEDRDTEMMKVLAEETGQKYEQLIMVDVSRN